jgi:hypothetical protein
MPPNTLALLEPDLRKVSLEQGAALQRFVADASAAVSCVQRASCSGGQALPLAAANPRLRRRRCHPADTGASRAHARCCRTSVTLSARLLQSAGLIRYRRGLIQVLNRAALEKTSCECYAVVKNNIDKLVPSPAPSE